MLLKIRKCVLNNVVNEFTPSASENVRRWYRSDIQLTVDGIIKYLLLQETFTVSNSFIVRYCV